MAMSPYERAAAGRAALTAGSLPCPRRIAAASATPSISSTTGISSQLCADVAPNPDAIVTEGSLDPAASGWQAGRRPGIARRALERLLSAGAAALVRYVLSY